MRDSGQSKLLLWKAHSADVSQTQVHTPKFAKKVVTHLLQIKGMGKMAAVSVDFAPRVTHAPRRPGRLKNTERFRVFSRVAVRIVH